MSVNLIEFNITRISIFEDENRACVSRRHLTGSVRVVSLCLISFCAHQKQKKKERAGKYLLVLIFPL